MWARISAKYHLRRPQQEALHITQRLIEIINSLENIPIGIILEISFYIHTAKGFAIKPVFRFFLF